MEGTIGEVRLFGGNFAPRAWAFCEGQLMPIAQNTALFSILGTTYGGDGRTTFALPDLRGRAPISPGTGPGLSTRKLGQRFGLETTTLSVLNLPYHLHSGELKIKGISQQQFYIAESSNQTTPKSNYFADAGLGNQFYGTEKDESKTMSVKTADAYPSGALIINQTGGGQSFNNMQPFLTVHFIICLSGVFPSRS
ncbi:MAG: tail fiber protein [Cytophagales bacterium]|nr:tail fiber protein [Cytophagales bacterium]